MKQDVNRIIQGDALTVLQGLESESVQCIITSPPYYNLRDYGVEGQLGLEDTPAEYITKLVAVFHEARRLLRSDGTLWLNIGDTYAGGSRGRDDSGDNGKFAGPRIERKDNKIPGGFKPKDLMMIPARLAIALQDDGWWLRSDVIWHKTTAMPESVSDRPTNAHEHLFLLAKSERYYYDADSIREPLRPKTYTTFGTKHHAQGNDGLGLVKSDNWGRTVETRQPRLAADGQPAGANKRNVWAIAAQPYSEAHFATMPPKLVEPCILAGTSPRACGSCGAPWMRQVEHTPMIIQHGPKAGGYGSRTTDGLSGTMLAPAGASTIGWQSGCTCTNQGYGCCVVLDPFMGSGTVAQVALQHNRYYLGVELNPEYIAMAYRRIQTIQPDIWSSEVGA